MLNPCSKGRVLLVVWLAVLGCGGGREDELRHYVPELPAEMVRVLAADPASLSRYGRLAGIEELITTRSSIRRALDFSSEPAYEQGARVLVPYISRLSVTLASEYACGDFLVDDAFWQSLTPEQAIRLGRVEEEMTDTYNATDLLLTEKIDRMQVQRRIFQEAGYWTGALAADLARAGFLRALGRREERAHVLRGALWVARREGLRIMTCDLLRALGELHRATGHVDSMMLAWDEALAIAHRHRLPRQAAEITSLYADFNADRGRLALAADLYRTARDVCREYKAGAAEMPVLLREIEFHAEYGFWEVVEQLLDQARVLQRGSAESAGAGSDTEVRLAELEARLLLAQGRGEEAEDAYRDIQARFPSWPHHPMGLYPRVQGLLACGRPAAALPIIGRGLVQSIESGRPASRARFVSLLARALFHLGNRDAALQALDQFRTLAERLGPSGERLLRVEWIHHDAARARLLYGEGRRREAAELLHQGLSRLIGYLAVMDPSAHGYLFLDASSDLRQALHELMRDDPTRGYNLELSWRQLGQLLGSGRGSSPTGWGAEGAPILSILTGGEGAWERQLRPRLLHRRAAHCLYQQTPDAYVRWSAGAWGVRCDTLAITPTDLCRMVSRALEMMSQDPGEADAVLPTELAVLLQELATLLLPDEVLRPSPGREIRELLITPDRCLELLPFETLSVGPPYDYVPLIEQCEVAYLRFADPRPVLPARGRGIVVADPLPPESLRRRYPYLTSLTETVTEAEVATTSLPGSLILQREEATKERLRERWEEAPFVYVAAHFVRDPEIPYLTFLPLSPPERAHDLGESYLAIEDIRAADLRQCRLVVLSGCASGAPYVDQNRSAPSLADAFLDSGASAVVQTFWRVRDEEGAHLMRDFILGWTEEGKRPSPALAAARRAVLRGPRGVRHPFTWAAYSVKLGRL